MSHSVSLPREILVLDACVTINLLASGVAEPVLRALARRSIMVEQAVSEVLHVYELVDGVVQRRTVEPVVVADACGFEIVEMREGELVGFIANATMLDDGEAGSLAVAAARGALLATDDRKAVSVAIRAGVSTCSTVDLLECWRAATVPSRARMAEVLAAIEERARWHPREGSADAEWWSGWRHP